MLDSGSRGSSPDVEVNERDLTAAVIDLARLRGWRVAHFHDSRRDIAGGTLVGDRDAAGFPDLVMVRDGRVVFAELKSETGRLSAGQQGWLDDLGAAGECHVWRPADWRSGLIETALS